MPVDNETSDILIQGLALIKLDEKSTFIARLCLRLKVGCCTGQEELQSYPETLGKSQESHQLIVF